MLALIADARLSRCWHDPPQRRNHGTRVRQGGIRIKVAEMKRVAVSVVVMQHGDHACLFQSRQWQRQPLQSEAKDPNALKECFETRSSDELCGSIEHSDRSSASIQVKNEGGVVGAKPKAPASHWQEAFLARAPRRYHLAEPLEQAYSLTGASSF
ncbi:hypothetical protein Micbo1qcDRAFT_170730 [Microdochium bolleyi]|uniref:Uncharacterized protein n=1 Tax=Microdochium bolleyi TaxID=196109 RepID=A0A136JIK3_9PEZI|nr:hypothetical protein Micbo1qcDRAFT_170730 [Microdochium bolleyi]